MCYIIFFMCLLLFKDYIVIVYYIIIFLSIVLGIKFNMNLLADIMVLLLIKSYTNTKYC